MSGRAELQSFFSRFSKKKKFRKLIENFREKMQAVEAFSDYGSVAASMVIDQENGSQKPKVKSLLKSAFFDKILTRSSPQNTIFYYSILASMDCQADLVIEF